MQGMIEMKEADIRAAVAKAGLVIPNLTQDQVADRVVGVLKGELRLMDAQGISEEAMEGVYSVAYSTFRAGKFENAHKLFIFLCIFDNLNQKYWLGLGACRYNLGAYRDALQAYGMAALVDPADPRPQLRGAECCLALNQRDNAVSALHAFLDLAEGKPKQEVSVKRARALLDALETPKARATAGA